MKQKLITVYRDEHHERKIKQEIQASVQPLQALVDEFHKLNLSTLETSQLLHLVGSDPDQWIVPIWKQHQQVPAAFDRERYIALLTPPDLSGIQRARAKAKIIHPQLHFLDDGKIKINQVIADQLITSENLVFLEGSDQHKLYDDLMKYQEISNRINQGCRHMLFNRANFMNNLPVVNADIFFTVNRNMELEIDLQKLRKTYANIFRR